MLENLIFSINAVFPMFLVIFSGWWFKKKDIINENFVNVANKLVFNIVLPIKLFLDIYNCNFKDTFDIKFIVFSIVCSIISFFVVWLCCKIFMKDKSQIGSFVQGSFRGNYALLGLALIQNVLGRNASKAALIVAFVVPVYNVLSVTVLTMCSNKSQQGNIKNAILNICKNPLIIGIFLGFPFAVFQIKLPVIAVKSLESFGTLATPLALLAIGGAFDIGKSVSKMKVSIICCVIKLIIQPLVFIPIAMFLGFTGEDLLVLLVMFGAPAAVASYTMAKVMDNDEYLASNIVVMSTLLSVFTFTIGIYILKSFNIL